MKKKKFGFKKSKNFGKKKRKVSIISGFTGTQNLNEIPKIEEKSCFNSNYTLQLILNQRNHNFWAVLKIDGQDNYDILEQIL